jgi:hypothetical protein
MDNASASDQLISYSQGSKFPALRHSGPRPRARSGRVVAQGAFQLVSASCMIADLIFPSDVIIFSAFPVFAADYSTSYARYRSKDGSTEGNASLVWYGTLLISTWARKRFKILKTSHSLAENELTAQVTRLENSKGRGWLHERVRGPRTAKLDAFFQPDDASGQAHAETRIACSSQYHYSWRHAFVLSIRCRVFPPGPGQIWQP